MGSMRDLTRQTSADQHHGDHSKVEDAVNTILKKLKRGRPVRLPGIGSLLPGAPPRFQPLAGDPAASLQGKEARKKHAKR